MRWIVGLTLLACAVRRRSLDLYQPSDRRGRSHHVTAMTGVAHGGLALPQESYSPEVGVRPNPVDDPVRRSLHDLVSESRRGPGRKR